MKRPGRPPSTKRNQELIRIRDLTGMSFERLGKIFGKQPEGMSKQAAWAIYRRGSVKLSEGQQDGSNAQQVAQPLVFNSWGRDRYNESTKTS